MLARLAPLLLVGCIFHTDGWNLDKNNGEPHLYVDPPDVYDASAVLTVTDDYDDINFNGTVDVRSLGAFDVVEWSDNAESVMLVVSIHAGANGEQAIAIDLSDGTVFASFNAH